MHHISSFKSASIFYPQSTERVASIDSTATSFGTVRVENLQGRKLYDRGKYYTISNNPYVLPSSYLDFINTDKYSYIKYNTHKIYKCIAFSFYILFRMASFVKEGLSQKISSFNQNYTKKKLQLSKNVSINKRYEIKHPIFS